MSTKDDLADTAMIAAILYLLVGAVLCYPCLVVGYYVNKLYGLDAGFYSWIISIAVLWLLYLLRQFWLIVIIYLVALVPFIFICIEWYKECYS